MLLSFRFALPSAPRQFSLPFSLSSLFSFNTTTTTPHKAVQPTRRASMETLPSSSSESLTTRSTDSLEEDDTLSVLENSPPPPPARSVYFPLLLLLIPLPHFILLFAGKAWLFVITVCNYCTIAFESRSLLQERRFVFSSHTSDLFLSWRFMSRRLSNYCALHSCPATRDTNTTLLLYCTPSYHVAFWLIYVAFCFTRRRFLFTSHFIPDRDSRSCRRNRIMLRCTFLGRSCPFRHVLRLLLFGLSPMLLPKL